MQPQEMVLRQFELHTGLFNNVLAGINDEESVQRVGDHVNHLRWIAGHITNIRFNMARNMGAEIEPFPHAALFSMPDAPPPGNRPLDETITYPPLGELKELWNKVSPLFTNALLHLPEQALPTDAPFTLPTGKRVADLVSFLSTHESYHIGQMGLIRKQLGHEAMSYA
ncbi:MAG: DinB family protein [Chitinophagia bacterium]|nr:DinB family protein [Chitinophagia bacterium]